VGPTLGAKFATALTSDGQLRRESTISGTPENQIFIKFRNKVGRQARVSVPLLREVYFNRKCTIPPEIANPDGRDNHGNSATKLVEGRFGM